MRPPLRSSLRPLSAEPPGRLPETTAEGLLTVACGHLDALRLLISDPRSDARREAHLPAQQLLMGLCLELALKAIPRASGVPSRVLKNGISHDLGKALALAQQHGFIAPVGLSQLCGDLARGYREHWWRYLPDVEVLTIVRANQALPVITATLREVGGRIGVATGL